MHVMKRQIAGCVACRITCRIIGSETAAIAVTILLGFMQVPPHERATREQTESYFSTGRYGKLAGWSLVRLRCAQSTTITDLINPAGFSNNA